jgi:hypothetical protein
MRFHPFVLATVATLACDPGAGVSTRLTLAPAPTGGCVDSTLAASRSVASVVAHPTTSTDRRVGRRSFRIEMRSDSGAHYSAHLQVDLEPDSTARLDLAFSWMGTLDGYSQTERATMARLGRTLLNDLGMACARPGIIRVRCEQYSGPFGGRRACEAAAR